MKKENVPNDGPARFIPALLMISALGLVLSGCAAGRVAPRPAPYDSPEAALRALAAPLPAGQTITATASILINDHGQKTPLKVALMIRQPASLRVESIPVMGPPDFFLSIAGGELRVFLPGKAGGTFYTGRATPKALYRFFPIALPAEEMIPLLMGRLPPDDRKAPYSLIGEWEGGFYRIDRCVRGRKVRSVWINPAGNLIIRIRTFGEGEIAAYTADFSEYTRLEGSVLPRRLVIGGEAMPEMTIRYTDLRQMAADPDSFMLAVPEGIAPTALDE